MYSQDGSSVSVVLSNVFSGEAYALLVSESNSRRGAYLYTLSVSNIGIVAVDLVKPGIGYQEVFTTGTMSGFGDAFIVYVDPSTKAVNPAGTGNPYMVYTAGNAIIYYDLTRGGSVPYPSRAKYSTSSSSDRGRYRYIIQDSVKDILLILR